MIFFNDNMSKDILNTIIENEINEITFKQKIFESQKETLLLYIQKITASIEKIQYIDDSDKLLELLSKLKEFLDKVRSIDSLFINNLDILKSLSSVDNDSLFIKITEYNDNIKNSQNDFYTYIIEFETFVQEILNNIGFIFRDSIISETTPEISSDLNNLSQDQDDCSETDLSDNNCLLISEKQNKVFLPYKIKYLKEQLNTSANYSDINQLIQQNYILPLDRFKNPILARFKEAYHLMKTKEGSSFLDAFNLAFELSLNSTLNPAVIAACSNKNELDIYLDCLYEQELDQFKIFDIKYELNPTLK